MFSDYSSLITYSLIPFTHSQFENTSSGWKQNNDT